MEPQGSSHRRRPAPALTRLHGALRTGLLLAASCGGGGSGPRAALGKMVMGIASGDDFQLVSTFCFTFPTPSTPAEKVANGHIHSQTIIGSSGHKLLVLNHTDLLAGYSCDELVKRAKVIEPLNERTKEVVAYDLMLNVEPTMNGQHIATVIARCGQQVNAEYIVEFTNPDGFSDQHFGCADLGLLQTYMLFSVIAAALTPIFASALRTLQRRLAHNDVSAIFFAAAGFFGVRTWLFTIHLLVYSRNGMGLGMLLFVAQFLDFLCTTMATLVLMALVHGVYVTRPCIPPGSEERKVLLQVTGGFTATYLLSTLICGFKVDGPLSPFGVLRGTASWPYFIARACTGIFCFNQGLKVAQEDEAQSKKQYVVRFSFISLAWLMSVPVIIFFSSEDSWHRDSFLMDVVNFAFFGVLLHDLWPTRFGTLFSCIKPTTRQHPYSEFGMPAS